MNTRRGVHSGNQPAPRQTGFVLPTAIFLLVILAALAAFMVSLSRTSQMSSALDLQGARAYQAARAGIEWAAWQVVDPQTVPAVATPCPPSPTVVALDGTLSTFQVSVTCAQNVYADGADQIHTYAITSTATSGVAGEVDYVERRIDATFGKAL